MDIDFNALQWLYVAIVAPLLGWVGGWFHSWRRGKRRKKAILAELSGLPSEAKSVLVDFYHQGTHTLRGDPFTPVIKLLVSRGHLAVGPGAGSYEAVNRYLSVIPHIWEVMPDWVFIDPVAVRFLGELLEKTEHAEPQNPLTLQGVTESETISRAQKTGAQGTSGSRVAFSLDTFF